VKSVIEYLSTKKKSYVLYLECVKFDYVWLMYGRFFWCSSLALDR